jgi:hypothetical protein
MKANKTKKGYNRNDINAKEVKIEAVKFRHLANNLFLC